MSRLATGTTDVVLVQEPWIVGRRVCGLNTPKYGLHYCTDKGKIRTCILTKKHFNTFIFPQFSDGDTTSVCLELGPKKTIIVCSFYLEHEPKGPLPNRPLQELISSAKHGDLILGGDANAHHTQWGSSKINVRGELLFNYLLNTNLNICNKGNDPTFVIKKRREVLDITLISESLTDRLMSWKVLNEHSYSDHRYIEVIILDSCPPPGKVVNLKETNWGFYMKSLRKNLAPKPISIPNSVDQLEHLVDHFTESCSQALKKACPSKIIKITHKPPWWTKELRKLKSECGKEFNSAKRIDDDTSWELYKTKLRVYKNEIRKTKRKEWANFCSNIESTSEASRLRKILSKTKTTTGFLKKPDGSWTVSSSETLELLLDTHFPGCSTTVTVPEVSVGLDNNQITNISNINKIEWAVKSFQPFKSPGPDGIFPAQLQNSLEYIMPWLDAMFYGCLSINHIPTKWRETKVIFIPKAGKASHANPKDFRPISLSSFLLKTLERLLDLYLRQSINPSLLSNSQHAYCKGRSTETALHCIVSKIEKSLNFKEYSLVAFLDIEGAFNNVNPSAITTALTDLGVIDPIVDLIKNLLTSRVVGSSMGSSSTQRYVSRGTPQGGVLSPLLWVVVVNKLLQIMAENGFQIIAYADDVAVIIQGKYPQTLCNLMENALSLISNWANNSGLGVNPAKTELVLFTRRYIVPSLSPPRLNNVPLTFSGSAKYLGVILDKKLHWQENITERIKKANIALFSCKKAIGIRWGFSPKIVHWLYTAVVRPILLYGILVWWPALNRKTSLTKMHSVQRSAQLCISGALRSTPTDALNVILYLAPLDILSKGYALTSALRLRETKVWIDGQNGHSCIFKFASYLPQKTDYCKSELTFDKEYKVRVPTREEWKTLPHSMANAINFYTDGSKLNKQVGGGVYSPELEVYESFRLPDHCSVYQAEVLAIKEAMYYLDKLKPATNTVFLFSDSQAALKALDSNTNNSFTIKECRKSLNEMAKHYNISLQWVPGHHDIVGNCIADELARNGTTTAILRDKDTVGIPMATCKLLISQNIILLAEERWNSTSNCETSRLTWPKFNKKRTTELLRLKRGDVSTLIRALTGHCLIGRHANRLGLPSNDFCRNCLQPEEEETIEHLICHCPAHCRRRLSLLGDYTLPNLSAIASIEVNDLLKFLNQSNWFNYALLE